MDVSLTHDPAEPGRAAGLEDDVIDALALAETGTPMATGDYGRLLLLGVALPAALLVWGWL
jgi:hypothetical protein